MATKIEKKSKSYKQLKLKADKLFSIYIRQRDMDDKGFNYCFTCGVRKPWNELQNGHYVSRSYLSLRYDERNCNPQCLACNLMKKGNLDIYAIQLMNKHGDGILRELNNLKQKEMLFFRKYLEVIIEKYEPKTKT